MLAPQDPFDPGQMGLHHHPRESGSIVAAKLHSIVAALPVLQQLRALFDTSMCLPPAPS